jgi:outer membrane lipoprotein SlyB
MIRFALSAPLALAIGLAALPEVADAQARVQYGRVTQVQPVTTTDGSPRAVGAILGGGLGLASGSGQSSSNRALRGLAGATAGRAVGNMAGQSQAFEYTVLVNGTNTIRIVSDQAGKRVGDCVSVEQGQFANIRLVSDARCASGAQQPASAARTAAPPAADVQRANACDKAKAQVLAAATDEEFGIAERRMRLLCGE